MAYSPDPVRLLRSIVEREPDTVVVVPASSVVAAARAAEELLAGPLPRRWAHVQGVAAKAQTAGARLEGDGDILAIAAWSHDVGYAPAVAATGFHPLDGARFLEDTGTAYRICALVAHHSAASTEARYFGCTNDLEQFTDEQTITRDLLWYCDMTVGPDGKALSFDSRMQDVRARYSTDHYVIRALDESMPDRQAAVSRARSWLVSVGLGDQL